MSDSPIDRLIDSARNGHLHHSLILYGPSPSTLQSAATRISKALNCLTDSGDDDCASCTRIDKGVHPDIQIVSPAKDRKWISIEQIRGVVNDAGFKPYERGVKVFIIEPADLMSPPAANSLLKTLEEPTEDTAFILLTSSADLLLPTIKSRCQIIHIRPEVYEEPNHSDVTEEILERLRRFATSRDFGALLGIAPVVLSIENEREGMTLLAKVLRDVAAGSSATLHATEILTHIPPRALLDAAQTSIIGISRLAINADVRLLIEEPLAMIASARNDS